MTKQRYHHNSPESRDATNKVLDKFARQNEYNNFKELEETWGEDAESTLQLRQLAKIAVEEGKKEQQDIDKKKRNR